MKDWKKTLSLFMALTMLVGMVPTAIAEENQESVDVSEVLTEPLPSEQGPEPAAELPEDIVFESAASEEPEQPEAPVAFEPAEETDESAVSEFSEPPYTEELTAAEEPSDSELPAVPDAPDAPVESEQEEEPAPCPEDRADTETEQSAEDADDEESAVEAEEPVDVAEAPFPFPGMGDEYSLSDEELKTKKEIMNLPVRLASMTPGKDYVEKELIFLADSEEYAQRVAAAYHADLLNFNGIFARIVLQDATVRQAVECAADPETNLPAVEPNYIAYASSVSASSGDIDTQGERSDWEDWISDTQADSGLFPSSPEYQYHHDILGDYAAWGASSGEYVTVAVLSTGVDQYSSDLDESQVEGDTSDSVGRGTILAELIAGRRNNNTGGAGVAPYADIYSVDIYDGAASTTANDVASGLLEANDHAAIILVDAALSANSVYWTNVLQTVQRDGRLIIAPMGDSGSNRMCYPAACKDVIAVAATDASGSLAGFSNYGSWCSISAPGCSINGNPSNSGTVYAAALVAGAAALYRSVFFDLDQFPSALKKAAGKGGAGAGVLNTANLFGGIPEKPTAEPYADVKAYSGGVYSLSEDGYFEFSFSGPEDQNTNIYYTLDGSAPSMKNGKENNPSMNWISTYDTVYINSTPNLQMGKTYTLKAIAVNGLGVPSKVATWKFRLAGAEDNVTVTILRSANTELPAGKSVTLQAVATNKDGYAVKQEFTWEILSSTCDNGDGKPLGASLSKSGKLTTKAGREGSVEIKCEHSSGAFDTVTIQIQPVLPTAKIWIEDYYEEIQYLELDRYDTQVLWALLEDKNSHTVSPFDAGVRWTTSNSSVVQITKDETNKVTVEALSAGTATVKASALDGSGKSASVKITVRQKVYSVSLSVKSSTRVLTPGSSLTLQATVSPSNASDRSIIWQLDNPDYWKSYASIDKGVLKLNKSYVPKYGDSIKVLAISRSDPSEDDAIVIPIRPKASSLHITYVDADEMYPYVQYNKNGTLKSISLLTTGFDFSGCEVYVDERYQISGSEYSGKDQTTASAANEKIASAIYDSSTGCLNIYANSAGTTTVTVRSGDGSKKLSFSVKVIQPMSGILIESAAPGKTNLASYGKSFKMKGIPLSTYGKPSDSKLQWMIWEVWDQNGKDLSYDYGNTLSLSQSGVLTVKKTAASMNLAKIIIRVWPANYSNFRYADYTVYVDHPVNGLELGGLDAKNTVSMNIEKREIYVDLGPNGFGSGFDREDKAERLFSVTSSNPKLVSAELIREDQGFNHHNFYRIHLFLPDLSVLPAKTQNVKITVKANDGSGKTAVFTVKVSK